MINRLFDFLNESPVNYLAVDALRRRLDAAGFRALDAADAMPSLKAGDKVYFTKNDSSLYAFHVGCKSMQDAGFHMICAHCDSPTFRIKPNPQINAAGLVKLNIEVYGGAILSTWFDRPLSLAGRVIIKTDDPMHPASRCIHIKRPLLCIPNLCIHFNREVNNGVKLSVQHDMQPILGYVTNELEAEDMLLHIIADELSVSADSIIDFDLYLYDTTAPCTFGAHNEFISAGRLDDLSMVHAGLEALLQHLDKTPAVTRVLAIFDNEETGSHTKQGAASPFLATIVQRMVMAMGGTIDDYYRSIERAFMISADNAHAWHPNYGAKYDPNCHCMLGGGPAIKFNAAQKYASDAASAAVFSQLCEAAGVPCQRFVNHSDVAGGSTLGNIFTATMPIHGVDMGNAILGMHSVRETGSVADCEYVVRVFAKFYE